MYSGSKRPFLRLGKPWKPLLFGDTSDFCAAKLQVLNQVWMRAKSRTPSAPRVVALEAHLLREWPRQKQRPKQCRKKLKEAQDYIKIPAKGVHHLTRSSLAPKASFPSRPPSIKPNRGFTHQHPSLMPKKFVMRSSVSGAACMSSLSSWTFLDYKEEHLLL